MEAVNGATSLDDPGNFVMPQGTVDHKIEQMTRIMSRFPGRASILTGMTIIEAPTVQAGVSLLKD
jgi:hypothetical protein